MKKKLRKGLGSSMLLVVAFMVLVPGGTYLFHDHGYVGSGIGTLFWGAFLLWFSARNKLLSGE